MTDPDIVLPTVMDLPMRTQSKFSPCSELNIEQLQIIMIMLACVPGIPVEKALYPFA